MVLAIHEADGQNVTVQKEVAYSLVAGGVSPGKVIRQCRYMTKILMTVNDQGGGVIAWNYEEVAPTLRSQTKHHEPIVVLRNETETDNTDRETVL